MAQVHRLSLLPHVASFPSRVWLGFASARNNTPPKSPIMPNPKGPVRDEEGTSGATPPPRAEVPIGAFPCRDTPIHPQYMVLMRWNGAVRSPLAAKNIRQKCPEDPSNILTLHSVQKLPYIVVPVVGYHHH